MASSFGLSKPRYPKAHQLPHTPRFSFAPSNYAWINRTFQPIAGGQVEHVLEFQFVNHFFDELLNSTNNTVRLRLNQKYHSWAGNHVPSKHSNKSCKEEIQEIIGSSENQDALCILEGGLNQLKANIWALKTPIGNHKWVNQWSFNNYNNVPQVEEQFCRFAAVIGYMTQKSVAHMFKKTAREIRDSLKRFETAYKKKFDDDLDFASRWEKRLIDHLKSIISNCREWFTTKFESFLENQPQWRAQLSPNTAQVDGTVGRLTQVRHDILEIIGWLDDMKGEVFD